MSEPSSSPCPSPQPSRTLVGLVLGQSNAANHGQGQHRARPGVFCLFGGELLPARDPLPGATGEGSSVWIPVANGLLDRGQYDRVVWIARAVGGSAIRQWAPGGDLFPRVPAAIVEAHQAGLPITHIFWHQGEADAHTYNTPPDQYQQAFLSLRAEIRALGVSAPIYICLATRFCELSHHSALREAQRGLVNGQDIRLGPDTDSLGGADRYDGAHFSAQGIAAFAQQWLDILGDL